MKRLLLGAMGALALVSVASAQRQAVEGLVNKRLPAFTMTTLDGKKVTSQLLRGKVILLDFWATWCGPCKAAGPTMQALHRKYASQGLVVIGANITDTKSGVTKYKNQHKYSYMFTLNNDAYSEKLGVQGIPAFLFVDRKGIVRRVETGFSTGRSPQSFEDTIKRL